MKAKVIKEYIDKHTQKFHAVGEEITLTADRFVEIEKAGPYVVMVEPDELVEPPDIVPETSTDGEKEQSEEVTVDGQSETVEPDEQPKQEKAKKTRRSRK